MPSLLQLYPPQPTPLWTAALPFTSYAPAPEPIDFDRVFRERDEPANNSPPPRPRPSTPVEIDLTEDSPEISVIQPMTEKWEAVDGPADLPRSPSPESTLRVSPTPWESDPDEPGPSSRVIRPPITMRLSLRKRLRQWSGSSSSSSDESYSFGLRKRRMEVSPESDYLSTTSEEPEILVEMKPKHLRTPELVTLDESVDIDDQEVGSGGNSNGEGFVKREESGSPPSPWLRKEFRGMKRRSGEKSPLLKNGRRSKEKKRTSGGRSRGDERKKKRDSRAEREERLRRRREKGEERVAKRKRYIDDSGSD